MKKLITTTPTKRIRIPYIGISGFERHLNRPLTTYERRIIATIANQTSSILTPTHRPATPIIVIDPPGHDSTSLLQAYVNYRLAIGPANATAAILTPTSRTPAPPARPPGITLHRPPEITENKPNVGIRPTVSTLIPSRLQLLTYRNPDHLRGHSISYTLLLNIQDAKTFSPYKKYPDNFYRLWHTLLPMLPPYGFLIVHLKAPQTKQQQKKLDTLFGNKISRIQKIHPETPTKYGSTAKKAPTIIITLTDLLRNTDPPPDNPIVNSPLSIVHCKRRG